MKLNENLRIIWAITAKDTTDAIKNKIVQGVLIGVGLMILSSQALSFLVRLKDEPAAHFWDQGKSVIVKEVVRSRELDFYPRDDLAELQVVVSQSVEPVLGIVIPVDFDTQVEAGGTIQLPAFYSHWHPAAKIAESVTYFEENLSRLIGVTIRLDTGDNQLYPPAEGTGYPMMIAFGVVLGVMIIGLVLTPYLIIDEKETHTLDALLISPARTTHLLIGKSLAGLFYSLTASLVIFAFSWRWILHWDLIILAVVLGGLCAVSIGLLVGTLFETATTVNMFVSLLIAGLLMPMYLWTSLAPKLSPLLKTLFQGLPSIAMYKIVRLSFTEFPDLNIVLGNTAILMGWILTLLILVAWRIRRLDR
jgi:ABC-type transport system involved in multi-copper enzyme maturation permease subunit